MESILRVLCLALLLVIVTATASALEITDEYIEQYGIPYWEEDGKLTTLVPLLAIDPADVVHTEMNIAVDHSKCVPEGLRQARHYHPCLHTHEIIQVKTATAYKMNYLSSWMGQGITITCDAGMQVTVEMSVALTSGIEVEQVKRELGIDIGGSYTYTQAGGFQVTVPAGYDGRLVLRTTFPSYNFDDRITYYMDAIPVYTVTEVIAGNTAEGAPTEYYVYLQLRAS